MRMLAALFVVALIPACGGRELGWLVPRASVGVVLRRTETGVAAEGYLALGAPLSGPEPRPLEESTPAARHLELLGPGPQCRSGPLCRWEAAARTEAFTELAQEEVP